MNLNYLQYFVSVVRIGSINQAANELFISPQGLSRAIRQLEAELDVTLFNRENGALHLTPAGETVYGHAVHILDQQEEMSADLNIFRKSGNEHPSLSIAAFPIVSSTFLSGVLSRFFRIVPNIQMNIGHTSFNDLQLQLESSAADIVIINSPSRQIQETCRTAENAWEYHRICEAHTVAIASRKSALPEDRPLSEEAYQSAQKVFFGNAEILADAIGYPGSAPILVTSDYSLFRSVLSSNSLAIGFSDSVVEKHLDDHSLKTIPLPVTLDLEYGYFIRSGTASDEAAAEFLKILTRQMA